MQIGEVEFLGEVVPPLPSDNIRVGDLNEDGTIDFPDFLILAAKFGQKATPQFDGDFDADGEVGFDDFLVFASNFGRRVDALLARGDI